MIRVFVSGFYDILHAGHVQFFREARALGAHLTVSFASAEVLWRHKQRRSSLPDAHKRALIAALGMVDEVVIGTGLEEGLDFQEEFLRLRPDILAVTEDDRYASLKQALCARIGARYVVLPKTPPQFAPISTTEIVRWIRAPQEAPLRVDFAGGWLDVPRFARPGAYIVNCADLPRRVDAGLALRAQRGPGRQRGLGPAQRLGRRLLGTGSGRGLAGPGGDRRDGPVRVAQRPATGAGAEIRRQPPARPAGAAAGPASRTPPPT